MKTMREFYSWGHYHNIKSMKIKRNKALLSFFAINAYIDNVR